MGWISAEDTLNEVQLHFETMEEAVAFATKNGLDYTRHPAARQHREAEELCGQFPLRPHSQLTRCSARCRSETDAMTP